MKKFVALLLMFILTISFSSIALGKAPDDIDAFAASEGIQTFKEIVSNDPAGYGYNGKEDIENVQLGEGFQVNYIDPAKLKSTESKASIKSIIKAVDQWDYVVLSNGKPKSFLTIGKENNELKVISAGGSAVDFGVAYDKLLSYSLDKNNLTLVVDKGIRILLGNKDNDEIVVPGISSKKSAYLDGIDNARVSTSAELISVLKKAQEDPDQAKDSGGLVSKPSTATHFPWNATLISLVVAFVAVLIFVKKTKYQKR
ncbi:hypothetical protein [Paenibacillus sp. S28]|uniref:hypothetical protein n=1 Tax=Paenibacillus sp. S28 TaxID=2767463 RepID=UPI0019098482|nr:hypothetical protein [Paenibacillus sp. S28]MBJ9993255.1 hypothetical protein [Paenibacillus sp. S28]